MFYNCVYDLFQDTEKDKKAKEIKVKGIKMKGAKFELSEMKKTEQEDTAAQWVALNHPHENKPMSNDETALPAPGTEPGGTKEDSLQTSSMTMPRIHPNCVNLTMNLSSNYLCSNSRYVLQKRVGAV